MPLIKTRGIILNSRPLGEIDRMVEIFSDGLGRIQGVAKGARSFKNRFGGTLEPFTYCRLNLFKKTNVTLYRIESADILESFQRLRSDLTLLLHSSCMIDILRKMIPFEDPSKTQFVLLYKSLERIVAGDPADKVLSYYQTRLLHISGVGPRLDSCLKCNRSIKSRKVAISLSEGGPLCALCVRGDEGNQRYMVVTGGAVAVLRKWQSTDPYHVSRFVLADNIKSEIREVLDKYVSYITGKRSINPEMYLKPLQGLEIN